jgi:hypothetical protein
MYDGTAISGERYDMRYPSNQIPYVVESSTKLELQEGEINANNFQFNTMLS